MRQITILSQFDDCSRNERNGIGNERIPYRDLRRRGRTMEIEESKALSGKEHLLSLSLLSASAMMNQTIQQTLPISIPLSRTTHQMKRRPWHSVSGQLPQQSRQKRYFACS